MANSKKAKAAKKKKAAQLKADKTALKNKKAVAKVKKSKEEIKKTDVVEDAEVAVEQPKVKTPRDPKKLAAIIVRAIITFILGAAGGFYFSLAALAKAEHIYLSTPGNADVAATGGFDTRLFNTLFDVRMYMIVCAIAFLIMFVALYGGKKRYLYLIEFGLVNAGAMLAMNFIFLQKMPGMNTAYADMYNIYFWFILSALIMGALLFEMFLLICSVSRFKRLESKGIVTSDGDYIDDLLADGVELITTTEASN